jgi:hypothetical protein
MSNLERHRLQAFYNIKDPLLQEKLSYSSTSADKVLTDLPSFSRNDETPVAESAETFVSFVRWRWRSCHLVHGRIVATYMRVSSSAGFKPERFRSIWTRSGFSNGISASDLSETPTTTL